MTQYDAGSTPMWGCFDTVATASDFRVTMPTVSLNQKNVAVNEWQKRSEKFIYAREDSNNDIEFNRVLWHGLKGDVPFPGPKRSAFVTALQGDDDDD
ncbi:MAG: hypothetical protein K1X47_10665, partial [Cyclobacteriaceae bacterium]|nr:hypothetical protein [Cyclobacteriaceae bacterium]